MKGPYSGLVALFFCRLVPPRSTFSADMSDSERAVMRAHVGYWRGLLDDGYVVVFGPVADPAGGWGVSVVEAAYEAAVQALLARDPVCAVDRGFRYEVLEMPGAFAREPRREASA